MASRPSRLTPGRRVQFEKIDIGNVSDYARYVLECVSRARRNFPPAMTVQLPALKVDVHLQEGALARSIGQNLLQTRSPATTTASQSIEKFIAHPGIDDVPLPAAWGAEPYWPHEVSTLLDREGLRVSYFHDLDQWQIFDAGAAVGVELLRAHDQYPPWEPGAPLRPFLHWHYANQGMRHARPEWRRRPSCRRGRGRKVGHGGGRFAERAAKRWRRLRSSGRQRPDCRVSCIRHVEAGSARLRPTWSERTSGVSRNVELAG